MINPLVDFAILLAITYPFVVRKLIKYFQNDGQYVIPREEIVWGILPSALLVSLAFMAFVYPLWVLQLYVF